MTMVELRRGFAAFNADDRGATVIETLVVFMPLMTLVYANIEIIMAFYAVNAAEKAAQAASRLAATKSSIYIGADMYDAATGLPWPNRPNPAYVSPAACYQPNGTPGCIAPDDSRWVCDGTTVATDADCDAARFAELVEELQRFYPSVVLEDVSIRYNYIELGVACGPLIPSITVSIAPRDLPVNLPSLLGFATLGDDGSRLGSAVSASLGEDMRDPNVPFAIPVSADCS